MRRGHASARQRRLAMPSAGSVRRAHRTLSAAAAGAAIDAYDREGLIDDQEGGSRRPADQSFRRDIARGSSRDGFLGVLLHRRSSRSIFPDDSAIRPTRLVRAVDSSAAAVLRCRSQATPRRHHGAAAVHHADSATCLGGAGSARSAPSRHGSGSRWCGALYFCSTPTPSDISAKHYGSEKGSLQRDCRTVEWSAWAAYFDRSSLPNV